MYLLPTKRAISVFLLTVAFSTVSVSEAVTVRDYCTRLDNVGKGALIAGYIDGFRDRLQARTNEHGKPKSLDKVLFDLEFLEFVEELFPSDPQIVMEIEVGSKGLFELLVILEDFNRDGKGDASVDQVIVEYITSEFEHYQKQVGE